MKGNVEARSQKQEARMVVQKSEFFRGLSARGKEPNVFLLASCFKPVKGFLKKALVAVLISLEYHLMLYAFS